MKNWIQVNKQALALTLRIRVSEEPAELKALPLYIFITEKHANRDIQHIPITQNNLFIWYLIQNSGSQNKYFQYALHPPPKINSNFCFQYLKTVLLLLLLRELSLYHPESSKMCEFL